ncbi:sulfotransferase [Nisaea acidiphila]|uniref:Sulfotransferase n=1 Tax=Nisaea acidiphila TaxID=1862145 RepID=A0A9J7AN04_9PROT|nr:tetratricopeptide repeat-containing sulfotransferase family protein [Nisaea acidiphila]UUX47953.1 sulfotransferase [Nisaea acidiphila]
MSDPSSDFDPVRRLAAAGRWREARERYQRILKKAGRDWRPYYLAGMLEASGGDFDRAERALTKASALAPEEPQVAINFAQVLMHRGETGRALELLDPFGRRLRASPPVQKLYGTLLLEAGREPEAKEALETALAGGDDPAVLNNLALIARAGGDLHRAATLLERALGKDEGFEVRNNLAAVYVALGRFDSARALFDAIRAMAGLDPRAHRALATYLRDTGQLTDAVTAARRAVAADPSAASSYAMLAELEDRKSSLDEALLVSRRGLKLSPSDQHLTALSGRSLRRLKRADEARQLLEPAAKSATPGPDTHRLGFELAQSLDALGDYDGAFSWFEKANRVQLEQARGALADPAKAFAEVAALTVAFESAPTWSGATPEETDSETDPVFLVGFPRSGTTLLDQVLDAHPRVQVLEERPLITGLAANLGADGGLYPGALETLSEDRRKELREGYFAARNRFLKPADGAIFVDKMPLNIVHAGLILHIFPKARFILALRHPCDVCLSCLMQSFALNHSMAVFCSLEDTARFYRGVFALWQLYRTHLNPPVVTVKYEDMTRDLQGAAGPVLEFLGLDWDDRLAEFHIHARSRGHIATPSYAQVTQPLYNHAVARWKRYGTVMTELAATLEPEIDRLGYGE